MQKNKLLHIAGIAAFFITTSANAAPLFIDFTDAASWGGVAGQSTYTSTQGSIDVTLSVLSGGTLSFNGGSAPAATSYTDYLALNGDGIGIGDDEIGSGETLGVSFSSPVTVLSLVMLDLHTGEGPGGASEQFRADFGAAGTLSGSASGVDPSGYFADLALDIAGVSSFSLSSRGGNFSDFALAGIWVDDGWLSVLNGVSMSTLSLNAVSVPAPGGLLLLGTGLFLMGGVSRRRMA